MASIFSRLNRITIIPYHFQMMALWDKRPNRRLLLASVHKDNDVL